MDENRSIIVRILSRPSYLAMIFFIVLAIGFYGAIKDSSRNSAVDNQQILSDLANIKTRIADLEKHNDIAASQAVVCAQHPTAAEWDELVSAIRTLRPDSIQRKR